MTNKEKELINQANAGNDSAYFYLGLMYEQGDGVEVNYQKAAEWYQKGVDAGNPTCKLNLGCSYINGEGVNKDFDKALKLNLEALDEIATPHIAATAAVNAAILYRIADNFRNYEKSKELCLKAIELDPDNEDAYYQLCVASIFGDYSDFVAPTFVSEGKLMAKYTGNNEVISLPDALAKYSSKFGADAYDRLASLFYDIGVDIYKGTNPAKDVLVYSGPWKVAAQLYLLMEYMRPLKFNDESRFWYIRKIAEVYTTPNCLDNQLCQRGRELMIKLAENGDKYALSFVAENCAFSAGERLGCTPISLDYYSVLIGNVGYTTPLVTDLEDELKATNKNYREINWRAFYAGIGFESKMVGTENFRYYDDRAEKYYEKMEGNNSFTELANLRLREYKLVTVHENQHKTADSTKKAEELSKVAKGYLNFISTPESQNEAAIGRLRVMELLKMKSESHPATIAGNAFENVKFEALVGKILPFNRKSMSIFKIGVGGRDWEGTKNSLYSCACFDYLCRVPVTYTADVLSLLNFDLSKTCKLIQSLSGELSPATVSALMLYLYETQGVLPKDYMRYVADECERTVGGSNISEERKAKANYILYKIYSGKEKVKGRKDTARAMGYLVNAANGGVADAQYEAALLAKKGKLAGFGIAKSQYLDYLRLAADGGNALARKKIK